MQRGYKASEHDLFAFLIHDGAIQGEGVYAFRMGDLPGRGVAVVPAYSINPFNAAIDAQPGQLNSFGNLVAQEFHDLGHVDAGRRPTFQLVEGVLPGFQQLIICERTRVFPLQGFPAGGQVACLVFRAVVPDDRGQPEQDGRCDPPDDQVADQVAVPCGRVIVYFVLVQ